MISLGYLCKSEALLEDACRNKGGTGMIHTNFGLMNNASLNLAWAIRLIFQNSKFEIDRNCEKGGA